MKKRIMICTLLVFVLVFSTTATSFASITSARLGATRHSNTSATATASATFSPLAYKCSVTMTLQEKHNGSWRKATGVPVRTVKRTKRDTTCILISYKFKLKKGKVYRTKVKFNSRDTKNGKSTPRTFASSPF